jgi:exosome complex component CSL4
MASTVYLPGQVLANTTTHLPGPGTHVYENNIVASILGPSQVTPAATKSTKPTISIPRQPAVHGSNANTLLPALGSTVLCRVTRVRQRELNASILTVLAPGKSASPSVAEITSYTHITNDELQFQAVLRKEDIRTYSHADPSATTITASYRVGDIILAHVISLGDERNYYISTAGNDFGVVVAVSELGNAMVPTSWKEMRDVVTGNTETRKVAKPS